jgi:hypothetical protein
MNIKIIECISGKVVEEVTTWDEAYSVRNNWQQKATNAGLDLTKRRYAVLMVEPKKVK